MAPAPRDAALCFIAGAATMTLLQALAAWLRRRREALPFEDELAPLAKDKAEVLRLRRRHFCSAQSVSYANSDPLMIVRGDGCYLEDEQGRRFLDTRNNVGHVGWQHQKVVAAVARQNALLNTNTRYLHPARVLLARRLLETFPAPLRDGVVFLVNSGSEANDLAMRLARAATKANGFICVEHGYHGHTEAVLGISPYKFAGKGGEGPPPTTVAVPCPDIYRGRYVSNTTPSASVREEEQAALAQCYAQHVTDACRKLERSGAGVAAFITESGMSVGGLVMPPTTYLRRCYAAVRAAGGVTVADEVQVGFGRVGAPHFWAFEEQGVAPDIVTMGKPFGNGHPLGAVVCTRAVADAFGDVGMEYFNTFGGNAASCAAGLAVLDVLEAEGLPARAARVGALLRDGFRAIAEQPYGALIGDVRGAGLFLGVDLVEDRVKRTPAAAATSALCTRLLQRHRMLTTIDGPGHNVLVVKPPLCFGEAEARALLAAVDEVLRALQGADLSGVGHTPT